MQDPVVALSDPSEPSPVDRGLYRDREVLRG